MLQMEVIILYIQRVSVAELFLTRRSLPNQVREWPLVLRKNSIFVATVLANLTERCGRVVTLLLRIRWVQAVLTEVFCDFLHYPQPIADIVREIKPRRLLSTNFLICYLINHPIIQR
jgi:hypothetical protein